MNVIEETIEATLDSNGQLRLTHRPRLPPGPVRVTIRVVTAVGPQRGLADVIREIAAEQRSRGFPGRSAEDLRAEDDAAPRRGRRAGSGTGCRAPRGLVGGAVSAVLPGHHDRYLRGRGQPRRPATCVKSPGRARTGWPSIRDQRPDPHGMFGPGLWPGRRPAAVGLFPILPRAEPAHVGPDCLDARPGQRYPGWSHMPGNSARSIEAVRARRRPPSRRRDRVRL